MRLVFVMGLASLAAYPASVGGEMVAGRDGAAFCDTAAQLKELEKAYEANDDGRAEATGCGYIIAGSKIVILEDTGERLPLGGRIVKVRAYEKDGDSSLGYASRDAIVDKK